MKFRAIILTVILHACVSRDANENSQKRAITQVNENLKFHPTYTKELEDTIRTLDLSYVAWFCQCANWVLHSEHEKYQNEGGLEERVIFIEPADNSLKLPDTIGYSGDIVRFSGQFYKENGYPKNYPITEMKPEKAKVFRYTHYQIQRSGYINFKE